MLKRGKRKVDLDDEENSSSSNGGELAFASRQHDCVHSEKILRFDYYTRVRFIPSPATN